MTLVTQRAKTLKFFTILTVVGLGLIMLFFIYEAIYMQKPPAGSSDTKWEIYFDYRRKGWIIKLPAYICLIVGGFGHAFAKAMYLKSAYDKE